MKFIISSSYLLKQLQVLGSVINTNHTLHILDNFLFEVDENQLNISASDLETTVTATLDDVQSTSQASVAISARLLLDTLKTFPDQPLTFVLTDENTIEISSEMGKYVLAYLPGEEFPKAEALEEPSTTILPSNVLATAVSKTIFAAGNDDLRPVMSGVYFQFSPSGVIFVATDAHKLVKYSQTEITSDTETNFIMPKKPLNILKNILATTDTDVDRKSTRLNSSHVRISYAVFCLKKK